MTNVLTEEVGDANIDSLYAVSSQRHGNEISNFVHKEVL